jgi:hypothetical protein
MKMLAEIVLVAIAALTVVLGVALLPHAGRVRRRRATAAPTPRPEQLLQIEGLIGRAKASALEVHAYLRPLLTEIASRQLAARGRALEQLPDSEGTELLGDYLWEIVRPERPFPEDRHGPGVSPQALAAMLETLERI